MTEKEFAAAILKNLPHSPTNGQLDLAKKIAGFIFTRQLDYRHMVFMLKGYAGTGKTSMISSLVKTIPLLGKRTVLLAPTGRAAKVLAGYSGQPAFTLHRKIYMYHMHSAGAIRVSLKKNQHKNTLFIVDEASMIQGEAAAHEQGLASTRNLLDDLFEYVYSSNCRLLLAGDTAQLPPVGLSMSPALDEAMLKAGYPVDLYSCELTEVVRQEKESGILFNATMLRQKLKNENPAPPFFQVQRFNDIIRLNGNELEDALNHSIYSKGIESTVVITRSNKRANLFNREVRNRILFREQEIAAGDLMMVVKNNYFWLTEDSNAGFIANGDTIEILRIKKIRDLYGFRFAEAQIRLVDYPDEQELELMLLLNTLESESPALSREENTNFFEEVMKDYEGIPSRRERLKQLKDNPYFNALQVKFAYALTCHKTQGGQWNDVFIDQGYLANENLNHDYLRWLYTALTRATKQVYLVNFNEDLFC